ncbi:MULTISPECIES: CAP domain-containing protein [unclassified Niallia]|uniref:CAP domain-containing protein n=1 Tax=Niallia TaxID=2837506 RepID=UPI001EDB3C6C|nr:MULTISPECIES: CAP domain-containing protein [unclassified Niallia]MCM3030615.1 CAP domain-containing protein [Niallia sp. MER 6]MDL0437137.1 CAP domain-containing protein [Niallia sp. SS-2023]UPO86304.1 CAP domain-containing protein [Niallia sp. Man26]
MKKKLIFSTAAAAALFMSNPVMHQADAASNQEREAVKVTYQSYNLNEEQINALMKQFSGNIDINKLLKNYYGSTSNTVNKETATTKAPTNTTATDNKTTTTANTANAQDTTANQQKTEATQTSSSVSAFEKEVVELTNAERAKQGLPALTLDTELSKVARAKSEDMSKNNYFDHTSPTYGSPFDMMKQFGVSYKAAGENIAKGQTTPEQVVKAWMNSEGHRANILSSNFTHIGVGYVADGNYWTQQFIGK